MLDRLLAAAALREHVREGDPDLRMARCERERAAQLALGLGEPAGAGERVAEPVVREQIALGHGHGVSLERDRVSKRSRLTHRGEREPAERQSGGDGDGRAQPGTSAHQVRHPEDQREREPDQRQVQVAIRVRLDAHLHQTEHGNQHAEEPEPAH